MTNLDSEIVNRKKQFLFEIETTKSFAFPNENIIFYIFIKNISGMDINNFKIKIEKDDEFFFEKDIDEINTPFLLKNGKVELFEMTGYCKKVGKYLIHFIAYGEGTQIAHELVTINCNRVYNSDKLLHRIHIYNFNPYEEKYSLEASDFSQDVTQLTKKQTLPYKSGEGIFKPEVIEKNIENAESQSFINQLYGNNEIQGLKHADNHSYQYIGREVFVEDSIETFTGKNLYDLIEQINNNSEYFKAKFIRSGTNHLLNDFMQFKPNGLIYRLGLLSSEIYHRLGIIPTFNYMNDLLFRWAPVPSGQHLFLMGESSDYDSTFQLINLYPKQKAMKWGENVWAGSGWNVYKVVTDEYKATDEFKERLEKDKIILREDLGFFETKDEANEVIRENREIDNNIRYMQRNDIIKYDYELQESLYGSGVFFINIPLGKIPRNFYLASFDELYKIVERAKPFGMKPIINYIIEEEFDASIEQDLVLNYTKNFEIDNPMPDIKYRICERSLIKKEINCNGETISYISQEPTKCLLYDVDFDIDTDINHDIRHTIKDEYDITIEQQNKNYSAYKDQSLSTLNDIKELLYNNNYNNISFVIEPNLYYNFYGTEDENIILKDEKGQRYFKYEKDGQEKHREFESIKMNIPESHHSVQMIVTDSFDKKHKMSAEYDKEEKLFKISYIYENNKGKETIKKIGYQNIISISMTIIDYNNREILLFLVEDKNKKLHYFYHTIVQEVKTINTPKYGAFLTTNVILNNPLSFETPFCYLYQEYSPHIILGGENWNSLYRINTENKKYSSIENNSKDAMKIDSLRLIYDQINLPETSIIKKAKITIDGETRGKENNILVNKSIGNNYRIEEADGDSLNLRPKKIECYPQSNESNTYYSEKLNSAILKDQTNAIQDIMKTMDQNSIFNQDIDFKIDFLDNYNDFISVSEPFWVEISNFTDYQYNLNNTKNIFLIIEGYNNGGETQLISQVSSETDNSSEVSEKIPEGYFYKKIPLLYPNQFSLELLRIRFRFKGLNHLIKIFNTSMELQFKNKINENYSYDLINTMYPDKENKYDFLEDYIYPIDINNGIEIKLDFDDLGGGDFYHINLIKMEIIYQDTDVNLMINKNKYNYIPDEAPQLTINGKTTNAYPSGLFYNDIPSVSQIRSNINYNNKGTLLKDTIFQSFETRDDNITSIEIFPQGFVGSPSESLKIGLYTNNGNTPGKLIKEIYANGWVKNNEELKSLNSIKYNLNVTDLKINETYWFKIQILNPKENSYYILKDINETLPRHKLLLRENNNYINSFNTLTFNIYSENLSKSFKDLPAIQEYFNNPYILVGLHKGQGEIEDLSIYKWDSDITEAKSMKDHFNSNIEQNVTIISTTIEDGQEKKQKVNFKDYRWDDYNGE